MWPAVLATLFAVTDAGELYSWGMGMKWTIGYRLGGRLRIAQFNKEQGIVKAVDNDNNNHGDS
ncbi:unnamed protein product [Phyllotreta striolata]|uniref:Uncharacterized protein n=1 Tax=Phyllotreta striolata TaxID=444603 RepID=A0A9N9XPR6_PHYSR|nr:unnamed protein product [Phyllotreta striolata]